MKKWIFVICPAAMLGLFLVFYSADRKRATEKQVEYEQAKLKAIDDKKRHDEELRIKSRQEQADKDAKKAEADRMKEAEKTAAVNKEKQDDLDATKIAQTNFATRSDEIKKIEASIAAGQKQRDQLLKDILDITTQVEKAKIERRTAEIEVERTRKQLLDALAQDPLMVVPPVPPPAPAGGQGR